MQPGSESMETSGLHAIWLKSQLARHTKKSNDYVACIFRSHLSRLQGMGNIWPHHPGLRTDYARKDGAVRLRFDELSYRMAIHPGEKDGVAYFGWATLGEESVQPILERLTAYGIRFQKASAEEAAERDVCGYYWFVDPVGIRHELSWGHMRPRTPFHPGRALSGFRTGDQGLGHVVVAVPELEKGRPFLPRCDGLQPV